MKTIALRDKALRDTTLINIKIGVETFILKCYDPF